MKILMMNQSWFSAALRRMGHEVVTIGHASHLQVRQSLPLIHINTILAEMLNGFTPEIVVVHDNSSPLLITGIESCPVPTVFFSVDVHHHLHEHKFLAEVFDATLTAQKDYLPVFAERGISAEWLPLWASAYLEPAAERQHGAVFVGTLDPALNPDRVAFFKELGNRVPILCTSGNFREIFPKSEVVINQTVKGDLNFRVFEAMMSGAMLLTERGPNGLFELFDEDVHLSTYERGNVAEAEAKIRRALEDIAHTRAIGHAGRERILAAHTEEHRARAFEQVLLRVAKRKDRSRGFSAMVNFSSLGRFLKSTDPGIALRALAHALRLIESGMNSKEPLCTERACHAIRSTFLYDQLGGKREGRTMLDRLAQAYPDQVVLQLARIRNLLNEGQAAEAARIAQTISPHDPPETFRGAEEIITSVLQ